MSATTPLDFVPRNGALRYMDEESGTWRCANPHDPMYSTVTMLATEYWVRGVWLPIDHDLDAEDGA